MKLLYVFKETIDPQEFAMNKAAITSPELGASGRPVFPGDRSRWFPLTSAVRSAKTRATGQGGRGGYCGGD